MFLLTHAHVALSIFSHHKLQPRERDQLIVGSLLPDVSDLGIASERRTHTEGREFLRYSGTQHPYLGMGVLLHGERPRGLDYYTHRGFYDAQTRRHKLTGKAGYLAQKYATVLPLIKAYRRSIGPLQQEEAAHLIMEFCVDHLIAAEHPQLITSVGSALSNGEVMPGVILFANYFEVSQKHLRRMQRIVRSRQLRAFLARLTTIEGAAHNFQSFLFLRKLRENHDSHHFLRQLSRVTRSSLGFLTTKLRDRSLVQLFERCTEVMRTDYRRFLAASAKKMQRMLAEERFGR